MVRKAHWEAVYCLQDVDEDPITPMTTQKFVYCVCSVEGAATAPQAAAAH